MIKLIQCVRRRPELGLADFRREWDAYRELLMDLAPEVGAVKVALSTTLAVEANLELMTQRGTREAYDGVAEVWWRSAGEARDAMARPGVDARLAAMQSRQEAFMDLESSSFFFALEDEELDPTCGG